MSRAAILRGLILGAKAFSDHLENSLPIDNIPHEKPEEINNKPKQGTPMRLAELMEGCPEINWTSNPDAELFKLVDLSKHIGRVERGVYAYTEKKKQYIPVVIDLNFYKNNNISRGDVVLFRSLNYIAGKSPLENPDGFDIARVVGLPGEKIKIEKGQIYINGGRLDTFYGKAHRLGRDLDELKRILESEQLAPYEQQNIKNNMETFEKDREQEEMLIPESQIFLVGDDWLRTAHFGLISSDDIAGKIIGYKK